MLLKRAFFTVLTVVLLSSFLNEEGGTRHFLTSTVPLNMSTVRPVAIIAEGDSIQDTLFQILSKDNLPVAYYQAVTRSVCFDKQCRLLKVNIYWNITGRYLGFELPKGEFLSKAEHEPFKAAEYKELNRFLADSLSPLKDIKYSEMVPKASMIKLGIDGVTSPTSGAISEYVVKGAGYTTYAMWHLIYGEAQKKVSQFTEKALNDRLLLGILNSEDAWDKQWAIDRLPKDMPLTPQQEHIILANINDQNFTVAENALRSLNAVHLSAISLQKGLFTQFLSCSYGLKNSIILKLSEAPAIDPELSLKLSAQLKQINGELFLNVLRLFQKHKIYTQPVLDTMAELLTSNNRFIASQTYQFLKNSGIDQSQLQPLLEKYKGL